MTWILWKDESDDLIKRERTRMLLKRWYRRVRDADILKESLAPNKLIHYTRYSPWNEYVKERSMYIMTMFTQENKNKDI